MAIINYRDIVNGICGLHELGIIHGNLKPQNILMHIGTSITAKVSGMGISKRLPADKYSLINSFKIW